MATGRIESIHIAPAAEAPTQSVDQAQAVPGRGLERDRYFQQQGTFFKPLPDFELTLIEAEAIEALQRDYGVELAPGEARRNLVTRGVALNHLVGREFRIGDVQVRGIRLCEPCGHLQRLAGRPVIKGLRHRGGLRRTGGPLRESGYHSRGSRRSSLEGTNANGHLVPGDESRGAFDVFCILARARIVGASELGVDEGNPGRGHD